MKLCELPVDQPLLVGFGSGYDLLVIWPYLRAMALETGGFPVVLNGESSFDASALRSGLVVDKDFRYVFTGDIPLAAPNGSDHSAARRRCLAALRTGSVLPKVLQNPLLSFQFEFLWDRLIPMALDAARRAVNFFARYRTAVYLDDYCAGPANRAWTETGNLAGIPTVTVPHGAVNLLEFYDFNSRWAFAWGELGRKSWGLGYPERRDHIIVSGNPTLESIRPIDVATVESLRNTVLLLTGGFLHQVWTDMDLRGFVSTWEGIARIARQRPSIRFIVKPHPSFRDLGDWYRNLICKESLPNVEVVDNQKLEDLLSSVFLGVLVGKPGTAGLVTALAGVPFVYLDTMLCRDVIGYSIWCNDNGVQRLTSSTQLAEIIDRAYSSQEERNELLEQNHRFLESYSCPFQPAEVRSRIGILA